jgi:hypothetical protein
MLHLQYLDILCATYRFKLKINQDIGCQYSLPHRLFPLEPHLEYKSQGLFECHGPGCQECIFREQECLMNLAYH